MILPFVTERLGGSSAEYGLYMAAYPLGFMLGALYTGWIGEPSDRRRRMLGALFFQGGFMCLFAWTRSFPVALVPETGVGVCAALFTVQNPPFTGGSARKSLRPAHVDRPVRFSPWVRCLPRDLRNGWAFRFLFTLLGGIVLTAAASAWFSPCTGS